MKRFSLLTLAILLSSASAFAAILPTRSILQKTAENSGNGIYAIEQEVQFTVGESVLTVKENWLIENDRTMRLVVTGTKELQGLRMQFIYGGGQKWFMQGSSRKNEAIPGEFLEKFFNFRSSEIFANSLVNSKIIPSGAFNKKTLARVAPGGDFKHEPEAWVRYSRTGNVVNYAFGSPTPAEQQSNNPGLWIEQDQFVIRKLRLPSGVEVTADNYSQFAKGLSYPRQRTIRWGNQTANIRLISAATRPVSTVSMLQPSSIDASLKLESLEGKAAKGAIVEFYSRFR